MKKTYYVVTNLKIIQEFKKSRYFRVSLGMSVTTEKNGERILSDKDSFAASYNYQYKTSIYAQGMIGNIRFYVDHYIREDKIAAYLDLEEFVFDYDESFIKEKGIDAYIGHLLINVDERFEKIKQKEKEDYEKKVNAPPKVGDPNKLINNPGAVTYEDIMEYMRKKRI
jgi:hypothetical protein